MSELIKSLRNAYLKTTQQLEEGIKMADETTYASSYLGRYFSQQALHALMGSYFWFRLKKDKFQEPFLDKGYEPEFENQPKNLMPREDLLDFLDQVRERALRFFDHEDSWLYQKNVLYDQYNNLDIALMQIRHMMYHVGYISASLMASHQSESIKWIG